jgi:two-component system cell cycle response regulator DivK
MHTQWVTIDTQRPRNVDQAESSTSGERLEAGMHERILVVEDNERNRKLVLAVLEVAGMTVEAVATGQAALDRCAGGDLDGVLLDIQLSDIDGVEVLHQLRERVESANLPIVALTAFAMEGDEARFLAEGFDGYLTKPIDVRRFADQVREVLSDRVPS